MQFANEIDASQLVQFRGAVIASLKEKDILFHNHDNDKLRYSYPLIQYKRIHGKAAVMGIGKGVKSISKLLNLKDFNFQIGKERVDIQLEAIDAYDNKIVLAEELDFRYRLRSWLPLNSKNYGQYQNAESLIEQIAILERVLKGNILSFLKGFDFYLEELIKLHITDVADHYFLTYKRIKMMAFDVEFKTNISLPQYIGLGKNASVGCGVLTRITN